MRVLGFGSYDLGRHPRVGIILDGLRAHGDDVAEANFPLDLDTAARIEMVRRPWLAYRLVLRLSRCWWQLARRARTLRRGGRFDAIVVGYLGQFDVLLARLLFPRQAIVLDQLVFGADTVDDRGLGARGGLRQKLVGLLDRAAIRAADLVVVDTIENVELLPARSRAKGVVVAVGASADWMRIGADRPPPRVGGPLRVVFFGLFTPLQGTDVIAAALAELADRDDIDVTMIGRGQQHDAARLLAAGNPHVRWLDWVAPGDLPATVAAHDVCLGIFGTGSKAHRVVPNKVYQGAAAGCALVTSDTEPQRRALGPADQAAVFVAPGDSRALAEALGRLADDRDTVSRLGVRARELATACFQAEAVVQPLRARLAQRVAAR